MMRMMDTGQDGKVSKEEMTKHHEWMVKAMDANGDGAIDASEMMGMGHMRRMKP
jgi:Ca2+-binding EF-hand superfamily protein